ncbi:alpha/beta hydrolase [Actinomadura logoneensis]|uniref:Alpha/beta hydrolase n=1 Tax=Actinomadura logoneensis TaxID=2293572 RepID=A0A372JMZ4_9ACTN|nr:alpha/beta hydrolase [Actinomadura logoneensis]RFU41403.1 alpha/beta hydrolase [Actinomadura logoneensis]
MTDEATAGRVRTVRANGVDLCVEAFGDPDGPAVLLLAGSTSSMLMWDAEFCRRLAGGERFVLRYDLRDTGRSMTYPPGEPEYGLADLAEDAVGVLDGYGIGAAHLVGQSMGGMIAQLVALDHPGRVASLTLLSSSPGGPGPENPDLSTMSEEFQREYSDVRWPDWSDRDQVVEYRVSLQRPCTGGGRAFEEERYRRLAGAEFDRAIDLESAMRNHFGMADTPPWRDRLGKIGAPTLVIHGGDDPVHPFDHAEALAREIPDTRLLRLDGVGHEIPEPDWDTIVRAITTHIARAT